MHNVADNQTKHVIQLQSLRGVAALVVLLAHCAFYYDYSPDVRRIVEIVANPHAAVVLFFVLSGFVLTLSLRNKILTRAVLTEFYLRRLFRLYPALWLACLIAAAYLVWFQGVAQPGWVSEWWPRTHRENGLRILDLIKGMLALGVELPIPIWTLFIELVASALMPLIAYLLLRRWKLFALATAASIAFAVTLGPRTPMHVVSYLPAFFFGAALFRIEPMVRTIFSTDAKVLAISSIGAVILWFGRNAGGWTFTEAYHSPYATLVEAFGAAVLILAIYTRPAAFQSLMHRTVAKLGDISYSLYILHLPIIGLVAAIGGEVLGLAVFTSGPLVGTIALGTVTLAVSVAMSVFSYHALELPGIRAGKAAYGALAHVLPFPSMLGK